MMNKEKCKAAITTLLSAAGIIVNGNDPWDIQIYNEKFYPRVFMTGSLGLGEAYMENWWDCQQLDEFFFRVLRRKLDAKVRLSLQHKVDIFLSSIFNYQRFSKSYQNGGEHYDTGNDFFSMMLDKRMTYTCAFWYNADTLDAAQENKLDLTCRKLNLKKGMRVLDIGCGWGSFEKFAAEKYGVKLTGITVSKEQAALAEKRCEGLPVEIRLMDYRKMEGKYDAIVSLGMFEHVGSKNYHIYMEKVYQCLEDNGLFLLHTIGSNQSSSFTDAWLNKYIFPNSTIPAISQIGKALEGLFVMEHWENFSVHYDKTLMAWYENILQNWDKLKTKYDQRFFRRWKYYLLSCAAAFRARNSQLWQIVLSKNGLEGGYEFR